MVSTFPPLKYSAKIHLRNLSAHGFGQNAPLPQKNSAWCKMSLRNILAAITMELLLQQKLKNENKIIKGTAGGNTYLSQPKL